MSITAKSVARLRWSAIATLVRRDIIGRGIPIVRVEPYTHDSDLEMHLGDEYAGVWVQVGDGYVTACTANADQSAFWFVDIDAKYDLPKAISKALELKRTDA